MRMSAAMECTGLDNNQANKMIDAILPVDIRLPETPRKRRGRKPVAGMDQKQKEMFEIDRPEREFQRACKELPPYADLETEIEWISAHPAMTRLDRSGDPDARVLITRADIVKPPHGKAPSRRAVMSLQHWANSPREFQKLLLETFKTEKKQANQTRLEQEGEIMDDLEEAKRVLEQYRKASK